MEAQTEKKLDDLKGHNENQFFHCEKWMKIDSYVYLFVYVVCWCLCVLLLKESLKW